MAKVKVKIEAVIVRDRVYGYTWTAIINGAKIRSKDVEWPGQFWGIYTRKDSAKAGFQGWYINAVDIDGPCHDKSSCCEHNNNCFRCLATRNIEFV